MIKNKFLAWTFFLLKFNFATIISVQPNTFMRNGKDPDPYSWLTDLDADPEVKKHTDPMDPEHCL